MPELLLFSIEIRRFFEEPRTAAILPAAIIVPFLSLWPYFPSPWIPAFAATFACVEPWYLNMWCLWPTQLEGLALRPVHWRRIVAVKNLAAYCLTLITFLLFAVITFYVHSGSVDGAGFFLALHDCLFAGIVLSMFGNNYSIVSPRPRIGWSLTDMAASILTLIIAGIAIVPVVALSYLLGPWSGRLLILIPALVTWFFWSVPDSASRLTNNIPETWLTTISS